MRDLSMSIISVILRSLMKRSIFVFFVLISQTTTLAFVRCGETRIEGGANKFTYLHLPSYRDESSLSRRTATISSEEVRSRTLNQLEKLREKDRQSKTIDSKNLKIVYEDSHLVCVDKPPGVLCVPIGDGTPSLAQTVFETVTHKQSSMDKMVVHRLGRDTSGLVLFAKTTEALRSMNALFRTRQISRMYEVLVCGHVVEQEGTINLPLMRDYLCPPFMRVSTDEHQRVLQGFDAAIVGKKLLEAPKPSQTRFEVISREMLLDTDLPVTRLLLTSITGRTHQLNVHCAAVGHPIVGDRVYGVDGDATPNGGLELRSQVDGAASLELQQAINEKVTELDLMMCVHAKCLAFKHPILNDELRFESVTPF